MRRVAMLLGAAVLLWAGLFAWIAGRGSAARSQRAQAPAAQAAPPGGMELFERHCAACHGVDEMRTAAGTPGDAARRAGLERFLEGHSGATSDENRQILGFLTDSPDSTTGSF